MGAKLGQVFGRSTRLRYQFPAISWAWSRFTGCCPSASSKSRGFDLTGSFLIKHLAFFFVPITVGLMEWGRLLAQNGIGIVVTLITSAAIGIVLSGLVSQVLLGKPWRQGGNS
jgi:hypothetical protein